MEKKRAKKAEKEAAEQKRAEAQRRRAEAQAARERRQQSGRQQQQQQVRPAAASDVGAIEADSNPLANAATGENEQPASAMKQPAEPDAGLSDSDDEEQTSPDVCTVVLIYFQCFYYTLLFPILIFMVCEASTV